LFLKVEASQTNGAGSSTDDSRDLKQESRSLEGFNEEQPIAKQVAIDKFKRNDYSFN
jgi:hypothetical protein